MWHALLTLSLATGPPQPAAPIGGAGGAIEVWSFERCLDHLLKQGVGTQEAQLRVRQARLGLEDARRAFLPVASATSGVYAGDLSEDGRSADFYLSLRVAPILDGYQKFFARQMADLGLQLSQLDAERARGLVVAQMRGTYLRLLALTQAQEHLAGAVDHQRRLVEIAAAEADPDLAAVRQLEAKAAVQREQMGLRELASRKAEEELRLRLLLGLPPEAPLAVDPETRVSEILPPAGAGASDPVTATASRASLNLQIARRRLQAARFESYPQPLLRMGLNQGGLEIKSGAYVFAGISLPLFDWGQRKRERARLALEVQAREQEVEQEALRRRGELARLELARQSLEQRGQDLLEGIDLIAMRLRAEVGLYQAGRIGASELTRTQVELARERAEHALNRGGIWAAMCQREALQAAGEADAE